MKTNEKGDTLNDTEKKPGPLARIRGLDRDTKALWSLAGAALFVAVMAKGCGVVVSAKDLEAHAKEERAAREDLDEEVDVNFTLQSRVSEKVDGLERQMGWTTDVLFKMAQDQGLRGVDAPPTPTPTPLPSPRPSPTGTP